MLAWTSLRACPLHGQAWGCWETVLGDWASPPQGDQQAGAEPFSPHPRGAHDQPCRPWPRASSHLPLLHQETSSSERLFPAALPPQPHSLAYTLSPPTEIWFLSSKNLAVWEGRVWTPLQAACCPHPLWLFPSCPLKEDPHHSLPDPRRDGAAPPAPTHTDRGRVSAAAHEGAVCTARPPPAQLCKC